MTVRKKVKELFIFFKVKKYFSTVFYDSLPLFSTLALIRFVECYQRLSPLGKQHDRVNSFVKIRIYQDSGLRTTQPAFTCLKSIMKTPAQCVKYILS